MPERLRGASDYTHEMVILDVETLWGKRSTIGLAELAARLGSPMSLTREGQLLWQDGMETGLAPWLVNAPDADAEVELTSDTAASGGYSAKLIAGTGATKNAGIIHQEPLLETTSIYGVTGCFSFEGNPAYIEVRLFVYDGTHFYDYRIRYDRANKKLEYRKPVDDWGEVGDIAGLYQDKHLFHFIKFTIDLTTHKYNNLLLDALPWDLTDKIPHSEEAVGSQQISARFDCIGDGGANQHAYIDRVIMTTKDPAV